MTPEELIYEYTTEDGLDSEGLIRAIIEECMFAFLISIEGKFDPIAARNILLEHFELEQDDDL